jgi:hypothetical protein
LTCADWVHEVGRDAEALHESQDRIELHFGEPALDPGDVRLRETHEIGHQVLPADRCASAVQAGNRPEIVLGQGPPHLWLLPEFRRQ